MVEPCLNWKNECFLEDRGNFQAKKLYSVNLDQLVENDVVSIIWDHDKKCVVFFINRYNFLENIFFKQTFHRCNITKGTIILL